MTCIRSFALFSSGAKTEIRRSLVVATSGLAMVLAGCDSGTEEPDAPAPEAVEYSAPEAPESTDVPRAATRSIEVPEGFAAEIPSNFPTEVPVPKGAVAVLGQGGTTEDAERSGVQLSSSDSPTEILDFYENEFGTGGWTIADEPTREGAMTATRGDTTVMMFVVESPSGGSDVYMITEKKQ